MTNEIIQGITEIEEDHFSGYRVVTNQRVATFLIDNRYDCCENWGYIWTNDDTDDYIGATLREITVTDGDYSTQTIASGDYSQAVFITLETDRGRAQFTLYNEHNGYYSHQVKVAIGENEQEFYV